MEAHITTTDPDAFPDSLAGLGASELCALVERSARGQHRRHYRNGRVLAHMREAMIAPRGHSSVLDYADCVLGIQAREAYQLMRIDGLIARLPLIRAAYASGELSFAKVRMLVTVATPESEERWLEIALVRPCRVIAALVRAEAEARAERGEAPWPGTGIYGPLGRPSPRRRYTREYSAELLELENRVWEKHNRAYGAHVRWSEFHEAALVNYEHDLDALTAKLPRYVRETLDRDEWRCRVPACSARAQLEVHHVRFRSNGGVDDPEQCCALCARHHHLLHAGLILIQGRASTGFRFAHRAVAGDEWTWWPGDYRAPDPSDPYTTAWDIDPLEGIEPPAFHRVDEVRETAPAYATSEHKSEHSEPVFSRRLFASATLPPTGPPPREPRPTPASKG
jgi:hypothetical protein